MDIETTKKLKQGYIVQLSPTSEIVGNPRLWDYSAGKNYVVTGPAEFYPNAFRGTIAVTGERIYRDNVIVPLTDGRRHFSLSFEHFA